MSAASRWPEWVARLPPPADGRRRAEGGRRLQAARAHTDAPRVTYVTVVRNGEATLERTLDSVRRQTWSEVEHVVVDGLSSDGTLALIERHAPHIDYFVSEPDGGLYDALNKAISLASGDLICVLNADDWLTPDAAALATQAYLRSGRPRAHLVLTAAWATYPDRRSLWTPARLDAGCWLRCADVCHNGVYATRGAYEASGPYGTHLRIAADFRWLMACVDAGVGIVAIDEPTVHYSMGGVSSDVAAHTRECASVLAERFACLAEAEVWGLMHAFHAFRSNMARFAASRPPHIGRFLAEVAHAHAGEADFMVALALASTAALQHPDDGRPAGKLSPGQRYRRSFTRRWMALRERLQRLTSGR